MRAEYPQTAHIQNAFNTTTSQGNVQLRITLTRSLPCFNPTAAILSWTCCYGNKNWWQNMGWQKRALYSLQPIIARQFRQYSDNKLSYQNSLPRRHLTSSECVWELWMFHITCPAKEHSQNRSKNLECSWFTEHGSGSFHCHNTHTWNTDDMFKATNPAKKQFYLKLDQQQLQSRQAWPRHLQEVQLVCDHRRQFRYFRLKFHRKKQWRNSCSSS